MIQINNGDVFNIGQTVNGVDCFLWLNGKWHYWSEFLWLNVKWHYWSERISSEYEYDQDDLTKTVSENEFGEIIYIKNIFN